MPRSAVDLNVYRREVESGLPCERKDLDDAVERQAYYDYDSERYLDRYARSSESPWDLRSRPHRSSGFVRECVELLCEHLYSPGPARRFSEPSGDDFLQRVYADNRIDAVLQEADRLSTLNDAAAIQIDAAGGDFARKPITYRLWGREQVHAWPDPDDPTVPEAVVTIDRYDLRTRYRLWSDSEVWTFLTQRAGGSAGGRVATLVSREPHDYGCLPFTFFHYSLPVRSLFGSAVGTLLHRAEVRIDDRLSRLDESIQKHLNPVAVVEGVPPDWTPVVEPMRFVRMPRSSPQIGASGGYEPGEHARLYFLQPVVDSAGAWDDLTRFVNQVLEAAHVPISAVRMEQQGAASGISLIVEQAPLLTRARARRAAWGVYEADLARRTLIAAGGHYDRSDLAAAAADGRLALSWPQPSIPIPTPDRLDLAVKEVGVGLKSYLMLVQEWYGCSRDEALDLVRRIGVDQADAAKANPALMATMAAAGESPGDGEDDAGVQSGVELEVQS